MTFFAHRALIRSGTVHILNASLRRPTWTAYVADMSPIARVTEELITFILAKALPTELAALPRGCPRELMTMG
jgi:hypothetical protein